MKRSVTVKLGALALDALARAAGESDGQTPDEVVRAMYFYVSDKDSGEPGWPYPEFLRDKSPKGEVELELSVEESLWRSLRLEAKRQRVTVLQLLEHAVLYYTAELDAGRVTERILDDIGQESGARHQAPQQERRPAR